MMGIVEFDNVSYQVFDSLLVLSVVYLLLILPILQYYKTVLREHMDTTHGTCHREEEYNM